MQPLSIVFDLDGTLVDTAPDLIGTLNHLLAEEGCAAADPALIRPIVGDGARAMLVRGFALAGTSRGEDTLDALTRRFIAHYSDNIAVASRPWPGLLAALDTLVAQRHLLGVCTNKPAFLSLKLIRELGLEHYFAAIAGADTLPVKKPDPGHLTGTIALMGGASHRAVMIGDSATDIRTAKAANIPVIALDFGYSGEPVATYHPDAIVSDYRDLIEVIYRLFPEPL